MRNTVLKGTQLTENDIEVVSVGAFNLYEGVIKDKSEVIGKYVTGDIISVIVFDSRDGYAHTPPELRYVRVITSTTSQGIDKADRTDNTQPVTVTVLVNQKQAELLAEYEKTSSMHFTLEYRGDMETAQRFLNEQEEYFRANTEG